LELEEVSLPPHGSEHRAAAGHRVSKWPGHIRPHNA
jgi:hypothetical protein